MSQPRTRIALLGASGSIGKQTLDVCRAHSDKVQIVSLAVHSNVELLVTAAREFNVSRCVVAEESLRSHPALMGLPKGCQVAFGSQAVYELASADNVDVVVNALVGAAGLRSSFTALSFKKRLALANKESLVVGGDLLMDLLTDDAGITNLLPVDSEHSAIFQCYEGENPKQAKRIWLTASGGPFYGRTRGQLTEITVENALAHPNWSMGPKITIDSATLMNKGLEAIEAHHLFGVSYDDITVLIQRESCIHSMVEYCDGSVKAHLGATDMRIPIQYALSYPDRWESVVPEVNFRDLTQLTFGKPDLETFSCLKLAFEAGKEGGTLPCVLNAANEVAVAAFLNKRCKFTDIDQIVARVMYKHQKEQVDSLEQLEAIDAWAREEARSMVSALNA